MCFVHHSPVKVSYIFGLVSGYRNRIGNRSNISGPIESNWFYLTHIWNVCHRYDKDYIKE